MSRDTALVSAEWVESHLDDPNVVLVEVDEDTSTYDKGHIRGAVKLDWTTDLQDQVRRDFVSRQQFEQLLSEKGIGNDATACRDARYHGPGARPTLGRCRRPCSRGAGQWTTAGSGRRCVFLAEPAPLRPPTYAAP